MVRRSPPTRRPGIFGSQEELCNRKDQYPIQEIKEQRAHRRAENKKQTMQFNKGQSRTFHWGLQAVQVSVGSVAVPKYRTLQFGRWNLCRPLEFLLT